jgi:hypothetical protein
VATGAAAKVMQDTNFEGGSFKLPKLKGQPPKLDPSKCTEATAPRIAHSSAEPSPHPINELQLPPPAAAAAADEEEEGEEEEVLIVAEDEEVGEAASATHLEQDGGGSSEPEGPPTPAYGGSSPPATPVYGGNPHETVVGQLLFAGTEEGSSGAALATAPATGPAADVAVEEVALCVARTPEGQAVAGMAASAESQGVLPAVPSAAILKEEVAVPPWPPGTYVKEEGAVPHMPPEATAQADSPHAAGGGSPAAAEPRALGTLDAFGTYIPLPDGATYEGGTTQVLGKGRAVHEVMHGQGAPRRASPRAARNGLDAHGCSPMLHMVAGTLRYANDDEDKRLVYEGAFKEGKRHGQGTLTYVEGDDYTGAWFDDLQQGRGKYTYAGGECWYDGDHAGGFPLALALSLTLNLALTHPHPCLTPPTPLTLNAALSRTLHSHPHQGGNAYGMGTERTAKGWYVGEFCDNMRHGKGHFYTEDPAAGGKPVGACQ